MYHLSLCLLIHLINISIVLYFIPYDSLLFFCVVVVNYVTSENYTPNYPHLIRNFFTEKMGDLVRCISDDMDSSHDIYAPKCSVFIMYPTFYPVHNTSPEDTNYSIMNLLCYVDPGSVKPGMDYLPQEAYSDDFGKWGISYHEQY